MGAMADTADVACCRRGSRVCRTASENDVIVLSGFQAHGDREQLRSVGPGRAEGAFRQDHRRCHEGEDDEAEGAEEYLVDCIVFEKFAESERVDALRYAIDDYGSLAGFDTSR